MKITRDVVSDLWPLYSAGEASPDTRALVDEFLHDDPAFAHRLRTADVLPPAELALPPEAGVRALVRTRDLLNGRRWLRGLRLIAAALTGLTIARVVEHTTWNATTRGLIASGAVACIAWVLYAALLYRERVRVLGGSGRRPSVRK